MLQLRLSNLVAAVNPITETITPYLPLIGILFGSLVVGLFAVWNRKRGNMETRAPDVNEIWQQQAKESHDLDMERRWRRRLENFAFELARVFRGYVRRVQAGGSTDLTPHERMFHDTDPPTAETPRQETKK